MTSALAHPADRTSTMFLGSIEIEVRSIYGVTKAYPVCDRAKLFADLAGTKTLTGAALRTIERMGFEIVSRANADWRLPVA